MSDRVKSLVLLLALLAGPALAQDAPPLAVTGKEVKQVTVATAFPVVVTAPDDGGALHQWAVPPGVVSKGLGRTLTIDSAPNGELTISVQYAVAVADWEKKSISLVGKAASVTFVVGGVQPPEPPVPDDARPSAALVKAMQDAYATETDARRATDLDTYAAFCTGVVKALKNSGQVKTVNDFITIGHKAANVALTIEGRPGDNVLTHVRRAMADFTNSKLPPSLGQPVDDAFWKTAATAYSQGSQAMRKVVK